MNIIRMAAGEIGARKITFLLLVVTTAAAGGVILGTRAVLAYYDIRAEAVLARKEKEAKKKLKTLNEEMRKATLKLSFNLAILPAGQDLAEWYEKDYATTYMPEEYVDRLARSGILTVRHFLPMLQQKVKWPEMKNRTIILVGCRGEVPNVSKAPRSPLVQPVPDGKMTVGYEIHASLGLREGQKVRLMGREFTVHKCRPERGSKDDISVWIPLKDAQELLGKPGKINVILALECVCAGEVAIDKLRRDVAARLPDTRVVEFGTRALARSEARARVKREIKAAMRRERRHQARLRAEREKTAAWVVPAAVGACILLVFLLSLLHARSRRVETAVLRAVGYRRRDLLLLLSLRYLAAGVIGGVLGGAGGVGIGMWLAARTIAEAAAWYDLVPGTWIAGAFLTGVLVGTGGGWLPALLLSRVDPARVLKEQ